MIRIAAIALMLLAACASPSGPGAKVVAAKFGDPYQGIRAAAAELAPDHRRLDLFIGEPVAVPEGEERLNASREFSRIIYCVALNEEKDPLMEVHALIERGRSDKLIFIYGEPITKQHGFWLDGVDCIAKAIGVWHPKARRYVYYDLAYDTPVWRWRYMHRILRNAVRKAGETALKKVNPL